jgi:hypothetical protein
MQNGLGNLALLLSNGSQPTSSLPFSFDVDTKTTMDKLRELVAATVAATAKEIDAYAKVNQELFAANTMTTSHPIRANPMAISHPIAANTMAISHPIAANATAFTTVAELQELVAADQEKLVANQDSHPTVAVLKENNIPPPHGTCDGHDHATGGIVLAGISPDPSGIASTAVLSSSPLFSLNNCTARDNLLRVEWQDAMDANFETLAPVQEKLAPEEATMANVPERLRCIGTTLC